MEEKFCPGCKTNWKVVCFWIDRSRPDGRSNYCKNCLSERHASYWKYVYYPRRKEELCSINNQRNKDRRAEKKGIET